MDTAEKIVSDMNSKIKVFVCAPYTKPDPGVNINNAVKVFNQLLDEGKCVPVCMLWTHFSIAFILVLTKIGLHIV